VRLMHSDAEHKVEEVGNQRLKRVPVPQLSAGEVGYVLAGMKSLAGLAIGDTLTEADRPAAEPVPAIARRSPVVFSSMYPMDTNDYEDLTKALEKLKLNDASLIYEKDSSAALGFGFRCGFLGLLHLDVVQERLEREYDLSLILSAPSVRYRIVLNSDKEVWVDNPTFYPDPGRSRRRTSRTSRPPS
jgi:GTP-binding protein LepA